MSAEDVPAFDERDLVNAIADTEAEIFDEASSDSAFAKTSADFESPAGDRTPEMMEGMDGAPLTNEQQLEARANGREPLEYWADKNARDYQDKLESTTAENERLKSEIARLQADPDTVMRQAEFARLERE